MSTSRLIRHAAALVPAAALLLAAVPAGAAPAGGTLRAVEPVSIIKAGNGPEAIAVDTHNDTAWIADNSGHSVTEIAGGKVRATILLGTISPLGIAVDSRTGTVWVADGSSGSVTEISAKTARVIATVTLSQAGAVANAIAVDPVHGEVFATEISLNKLVEFSERRPATQHVVADGNTPLAVAADSESRTAWVSDEAGTVTEISYADTKPRVLHTLPVSGGPGAITADATTGLIVVVKYSAHAAAIISAASRKVHTVKVGDDPGSLDADPLHGDVWVANDGGDSLSQIRESTRRVLATYPLGFSPTEVAVQPGSGVYAVNFLANSVTFLPAALRISAPRSATFKTGRHGSVVIAVSGFPVASVTLSGRLPAGVHWSRSGHSARITGTPRSGTKGSYHLTLRAETSWGRHVSRRLTITVR